MGPRRRDGHRLRPRGRRRAGGRPVPRRDARGGARLLRAQVRRSRRPGRPARAARASRRTGGGCREGRRQPPRLGRRPTPSATSTPSRARLEALARHAPASSPSSSRPRRRPHVDEAIAERTRIVEQAEALAARTRARRSGSRRPPSSTPCSRSWQAAPAGRPAPAEDEANELWKRFRDARSTIEKHRKAFFAELDAAHKDVRDRKQALIEQAEALAPQGRRRRSPTTAPCSTSGSSPAAPARSSTTPSGRSSRPRATRCIQAQGRGRRAGGRGLRGRTSTEKLALLDEAEKLARRRPTASKARSALTGIQRSWDEIGARPARPGASGRGRLRKVETHVRAREDERLEARTTPRRRPAPRACSASCRTRSRSSRPSSPRPRQSGDKRGDRDGAARRSRRVGPGSRPSAADGGVAGSRRRHSSAARVRGVALSTGPRARRATLPGCRSMSAWPGFPRYFGTDHLPLAELSAARLDGDLFAIDDGWAPVDEPDLPAFRAMATAMRAPRRAHHRADVGARGSTARCDAPPAVAQFCVPLDARIAVIGDRRALGARGADRRRRPRAVRRDPLHLAGTHRIRPAPRPDARRRRGRRRRRRADRRSTVARGARCTTGSTLPCACRTRRRPADGSSAPSRVGVDARQSATGLSRRHAVDVVDGVDAPHGVQHAVEVDVSPISNTNRLSASRSVEVETVAERMLTWCSLSTRVTSREQARPVERLDLDLHEEDALRASAPTRRRSCARARACSDLHVVAVRPVHRDARCRA